jgi:hypothetical protein
MYRPGLSSNPNAIPILEQHLDKVCWHKLSSNPNAIHILEQHLDKVQWWHLSLNSNAISILERHLDKVFWSWLSYNPNAIHLLERNLAFNDNAVHLFTSLNTEQMRSNCKAFSEELAQYVFHPLRIKRLADRCGLDMDEYLELF